MSVCYSGGKISSNTMRDLNCTLDRLDRLRPMYGPCVRVMYTSRTHSCTWPVHWPCVYTGRVQAVYRVCQKQGHCMRPTHSKCLNQFA